MAWTVVNFKRACKKAVAKGAEFLDSHFGNPNWDKRINFDTLDMGWQKDCICGQLHIDDLEHENKSLPFVGELGFFARRIPHGEQIAPNIRNEILKQFWIDLINERQIARKTSKKKGKKRV